MPAADVVGGLADPPRAARASASTRRAARSAAPFGAPERRSPTVITDSVYLLRSIPAKTFYARPWELLRANDVPFSLHRSKFQPEFEPWDRSWVGFFRAHYPRWDDFLRLRAERDPNNIFLTGPLVRPIGLRSERAPSPRR